MPTYMGCVETPIEGDTYNPMRWIVGSEGLLKVDAPPPLDRVYLDQHNDPGVSSLWLDHHRHFRDFIVERADVPRMLEIGGANGTLASLMGEVHNPFESWTIIEPNPHVSPDLDVEVIVGWFPQDLPKALTSNTCLSASHVLEHAINPYDFLAACSNALPENGQLFLTWPDMEAMATRTDLNMLNFEHLHYLPRKTVDQLLEIAGFETLASYDFRGHSIFIQAKKVRGAQRGAPKIEGDSKALRELASEYKRTLVRAVAAFSEEVDTWSGKCWLFGGHIFSQFLLAGGLTEDDYEGILDNSSNKWGKRLYGTGLNVRPPESLRGTSGNLIVVAAALYEEEILDQLRGLDLSDSRIVTSRNGTHNL